jgi:hypothetical protein
MRGCQICIPHACARTVLGIVFAGVFFGAYVLAAAEGAAAETQASGASAASSAGVDDKGVPGLKTEAAPTNVNSVSSAAPAQISQTSGKSPEELALQNRVRELESEVIKLWNYIAATRRLIPGESRIGEIADSRATQLINRYLGGNGEDGTRLPVLSSDGGVSLAHIVVGGDTAEENMTADGIRIALVARGSKSAERTARLGAGTFVTVYALPANDQMLRPSWLIHADEAVPYIDGISQTHFTWNGKYLDGTKAEKGKYHIFVRVIVRESETKTLGGAMRYWGVTAGSSPGNTLVIKE